MKNKTENLRPAIRRMMDRSGRVCVVVDDDPTGNQTVYGIPLLSSWSIEALDNEFRSGSRAFYLLTNSRSVNRQEAARLGREIGERLRTLSCRLEIPLSLVSRSDSTLRGHFPVEVDALASGAGLTEAIRILVPALFEGGRITAGDVHYVKEGEALIPVSETPFARDPAFAYRSSHLKDWVEEKTGGSVPAGTVNSVSLEDIREGGTGKIRERMLETPPGGVCIINATDYGDMDRVCLACRMAEEGGGSLIYRTSSSFVPSYIGLEPAGLLAPSSVGRGSGGGLIIVGSHVPKTTGQLEDLLQNRPVEAFELETAEMTDPRGSDRYVSKVVEQITPLLQKGEDVALYTGRKVFSTGDRTADFEAGLRITSSVTRIVQHLKVHPRYLLAKGGITAHDVAVNGLGMKRCLGRGQLIPGVPVWKMGGETRFPGLDYIVFPGNVGSERALTGIVTSLAKN